MEGAVARPGDIASLGPHPHLYSGIVHFNTEYCTVSLCGQAGAVRRMQEGGAAGVV